MHIDQVLSLLFNTGYFKCVRVKDILICNLRWFGTIHVWVHHKIKMLVSAKALPTDYLRKSAFIKHLLIYLIQQTKVFNCGLKAS